MPDEVVAAARPRRLPYQPLRAVHPPQPVVDDPRPPQTYYSMKCACCGIEPKRPKSGGIAQNLYFENKGLVPVCYTCYVEGKQADLRECKTCGTKMPNEAKFCYLCRKTCPECKTTSDSAGRWKQVTNYYPRPICPDCYAKAVACSRCQKSFLGDEAINFLQGPQPGNVCQTCRLNHYRYCMQCDAWCRADHTQTKYIGAYNTKPAPEFFGEDEDNLFFGLELEVETCKPRDTAAAIVHQRLKGVANLKYDASIWHGFEIVTHPIAFSALKQHLSEPDFRVIAEACHADSETTCGMHVHLSRKAFTPETLYNFVYFQYANVDLITRVAGRYQEHHAPFEPVSITTMEGWTKGSCLQQDRHTAINLLPTATVEIRYFQSTLDWRMLQARLQFLHAVYKYTQRRTKIGAIRVNRHAFGRYVEHHSSLYPELMVFLKEWIGDQSEPVTALQDLQSAKRSGAKHGDGVEGTTVANEYPELRFNIGELAAPEPDYALADYAAAGRGILGQLQAEPGDIRQWQPAALLPVAARTTPGVRPEITRYIATHINRYERRAPGITQYRVGFEFLYNGRSYRINTDDATLQQYDGFTNDWRIIAL